MDSAIYVIRRDFKPCNIPVNKLHDIGKLYDNDFDCDSNSGRFAVYGIFVDGGFYDYDDDSWRR